MISNASRQPLHVAFNITASYASLCSIVLHSLCKHNPNACVHAHILATGMTPEACALIERVAEKHGVEVHHYDATEAVAPLARVYSNKRYHLSVNYRMFVADLLPSDIERVLYLDCDTLVRGSVAELCEHPLSAQCAAVVVRDAPIYVAGKRPRRVKHSLGVDYFNSGMMLINLDYWRRERVSEQCVASYAEQPEDYPFPDQDVLNVVLRGHVDYVSPRWNCFSYFFTHEFYQQPGVGEVDYDLLRGAVILHFINRNKPWTARCTHPYREAYLEVCREAVGEGWIKQHRTLGYYLFRPIYRLLIALGVKRSYIKLPRQ